MAGNPNSLPAAGTPPADVGANGGKDTGTNQPAKTPGSNEPPKTFTQEQLEFHVQDRLRRDREAREKDLGVPLKDAKTIIEAHRQAEELKKTDLQKATEKTTSQDQTIAGLKLQIAITNALLAAGANPTQIPKLAIRVIGETPEEIAADIAEFKKDMPQLFGGVNTAPSGGAHPGLPNTAPGANQPRVYKRSEIKAMTYEDHIKFKSDIQRAMGTPGGIIED